MPPIIWNKNKGRNGWDSPLEVGMNQSVESRNLVFYRGGLGAKRAGSTSMTVTNLTLPLRVMIEFVPGQDLTAASLIAVDNTGLGGVARTTSGGSTTAVTFSILTLRDTLVNFTDVHGVALNGKLYVAYSGAVNRLHVYDPARDNTILRRAGLAPFAAAATVTNTGGGAYPATLRYYKTRLINKPTPTGVIGARSEANASVSFTPSGGGTAARITEPTLPLVEDYTHWELYGSTDNVTFYGPIATTLAGTTTYDDSSTPSTWATTYDAEPTAGTYTPFPSVKYLGTDGTRLVGFGVWETSAGNSMTPVSGMAYIGPVLDSTATEDDERINNTTTLQGTKIIARNAGAADRGMTRAPVNNIFYLFQSAGIYGLVPTESPSDPYRRVVIDSRIGALNNQSIVLGADQHGQACAFFLDPIRGPYTVGGPNGLRWCGKDVKDVWDTINQNATSVVAWGLWYADRNLLLFGIATGSSNTPDTILALDVTQMEVDEYGDLRGGWSVWSGDVATSWTAAMFSTTFAATRSLLRVPYISSTVSKMLKYDETKTADDTTAFQAYVTSGVLAQDTQDLEVQRAYLAASAETGVTIQQSLIRNFGDETNRVSTVVLTPEGSETTVLKKFDDAALQDAWAIQVTVGDAAAVSNAWTLYQWRSDITGGAPR